MTPGRRRTVIWLSIAGGIALIVGFWSASGPPGVVDLIGYEEIQPGVVDVALQCHNEVDGHFKLSFGDTTLIFATGSDPDRFSFGRDGCLSSGRIDIGEPIGERRLIDGFDFETIGPLP
ncbi:MAG TPA: hypothetical protein VFP42_03510 [Acidimicrobiia bacterium]|nr:hypothetical protein [Acidimicrobiia bacterium]